MVHRSLTARDMVRVHDGGLNLEMMNFIEEIVSKSNKRLKFRFPPEPNAEVT